MEEENKMRQLYRAILFVFIFFVVFSSISFALSPETHENINEFVAKNTLDVFLMDAYLQNQLGFENGVYEEIKGNYWVPFIRTTKPVWKWIKIGGRYEDKPPWVIPYLRSVNHFHDPLTEEGFSGFFFGLLLSGDSSVVWAQKPLGVQKPGGHYSWQDARDYFYNALTLTNKTDRDDNFAKTFRAMGQLMHLVEDVSVPAHVRNDGHLVGYEEWVGKNINISTISPIFFDKSIFDRPISGLPIANIFDTNQYSGTNPNVTIGSYIGLSEFTNSNFFSEDTIFNNYPHPAEENTTAQLVQQNAKDGQIDETWYIQGYTSQRLAAYSYFWNEGGVLINLGRWKYHLDDFVYSDYASQLIPRAIGYSAGLLDYFFRGEIEITLPDSGVYALTNDSGTGFTKVTLLAKNTTSTGEEMTDGSIELVVKYKLAQEDPFQSYPVPTEEFTYNWQRGQT